MLPAFKALSDWQWNRLHARQAYNKTIEAHIAEPAVELDQLIQDGSNPLKIQADSTWRSVQVTGTWDNENQVLVRKKSMESDAGFWVITPFITNQGYTVMVNRGWRAAGDSAVDNPDVTPAPSGQVEIAGRVREVAPRSKTKPTDLPNGQVDTVIPTEIVPGPETISDIYLEMTASRPESRSSELREMPAPEITEGPHRSYALQWIFFSIMTVIGWAVLVRNEVAITKQDKESETK